MLTLAAGAAGAQLPGPAAPAVQTVLATAALDGVVRDSAGRALAFAVVAADSAGRTVATDSAGAFHLGGLRPGLGRFTVRRIGYLPSTFEIDLAASATVHLAITMRPAIPRLTTVVVNGELRDAALDRVGFYGRAATATARFGSGRFLTPEALEPWRGSWLSIALAQVPFVRLDGPPGRVRAQFRDAHARLGCSPGVWIDGTLSPTPFAALDGLLPVEELRGIEVYPWPRSVPLQFRVAQSRPTCGAVVIWTNRLDPR